MKAIGCIARVQNNCYPTGRNKTNCCEQANLYGPDKPNHDKCNQLELQLQTVANEVSSLKLITNTLDEESKSLKPSPQPSSNTTNPWTTTTVNNRYSSRTSIHPQSSSYETSRRRQYAVPVTNRHAAQSNSQQTSDSTYSPSPEQQPRYSKETNLNHSKKHYWKNSATEFQNQNSTTHPLTNHNPQEANGTKKKQDTSQQV